MTNLKRISIVGVLITFLTVLLYCPDLFARGRGPHQGGGRNHRSPEIGRVHRGENRPVTTHRVAQHHQPKVYTRHVVRRVKTVHHYHHSHGHHWVYHHECDCDLCWHHRQGLLGYIHIDL